MKKRIKIAGALLLAWVCSSAQLVEVESIDKVTATNAPGMEIPTISPDAAFAVVGCGKGLVKVDLATGETVKIDDLASPYGVLIADGKVYYRKSHIDDDYLTTRSVEAYDVATGTIQNTVPACRDLTSNAATAVKPLAASIDHGHLKITNNGNETVIDPQGRASYLWPSISPDGTRVVYYAAGLGAFVANIDGTNPLALGQLRAPQWLGNDLVVAMNDFANITGTKVTSSAIVVADMQGTRQTLTSDSMRAMYPSVSADAKKIAFTIPEGDLYVITLK